MQVLPLFIIGYMITSFACMSAVVIQTAIINEQTTGKIRQYACASLWLSYSVG